MVLLQWLPIESINAIEYGLGWINVIVVVGGVDPSLYLLAGLRAIVDEGHLPSFAETNEELLFFTANNASTLSNATFGVDYAGYNSGNYLLGLMSLWSMCT